MQGRDNKDCKAVLIRISLLEVDTVLSGDSASFISQLLFPRAGYPVTQHL